MEIIARSNKYYNLYPLVPDFIMLTVRDVYAKSVSVTEILELQRKL